MSAGTSFEVLYVYPTLLTSSYCFSVAWVHALTDLTTPGLVSLCFSSLFIMLLVLQIVYLSETIIVEYLKCQLKHCGRLVFNVKSASNNGLNGLLMPNVNAGC